MFSSEKFLGISWLIPAVISLAIAIAYYFFWPSEKVNSDTSNIVYFILRYGHSLTWVFLMISSLIVYFYKKSGFNIARIVGLFGLISYLAFIITTIITPSIRDSN